MTEVLLAALRARANGRGIMLVTESTLVRECRTDGTALRQELNALAVTGEIEILAPLPWLIARVSKSGAELAPRPPSWSGKRPDRPEPAAKTAAPRSRAYSFQSYSQQSKRLNESYRQLDTNDALLREVLETLGETDPATFRGALRSYSPSVIRNALGRVRRTPAIRKNRTALFRYLLPRLAKERPPTK